jgi:signal transduction histidine kinase
MHNILLLEDSAEIRMLLKKCLTDFCLQMRIDMGTLLVTGEDGKLVQYASHNMPRQLRERLSDFLLTNDDPLSSKLREVNEGLCVESIDQYETLYHDHVLLAKQHGIRSLLLLPLERDGVKTGLLLFFYREKRLYGSDAIRALTISLSETAYAIADARQLKLLKERVHILWKESHIPFDELKLLLPECENCVEDCEQCHLHKKFCAESPQDILVLTRALLKRVEHYMITVKKRGDELETLVSERTRRLEDEKLKAQSAARAKSEFLASMSHELRSPLNSIIGFAERIPSKVDKVEEGLDGLLSILKGLVRENGKSTDGEILNSICAKEIKTVHEFCGYIRSSGSHLLDLINDILNLSRIEAGKLPLSAAAIEFRPYVEAVIASFKNAAEEKNLKIVLEIDDISPHIYVDKIRFDQILFNLVGNAVKFSRPGEIVKITAREIPVESAVEFCVLDNGEGIPEEFREQIFNRFERADTSGVKQGAGLGLAIAKKLVELMGGRIWYESVPGEGSRFYFTVPTDKICEVR